MHVTSLAVSTLCLLAMPATPVQDESVDPAGLIESGWNLLPPYDGAQRWFLTAVERRETTAAAHLFSAAVTLEPENLLGWWRRAHAYALLAEDDRNRGDMSAARQYTEQARAALERAIALDPKDPWSRYSRGVLATNDGDQETAIVEFDAALSLSAPRIAAAGAEGPDAWLAFKVREWTAEVLMRAGRFERARNELRSINTDFGENIWPLHIALAESFERERDLASARAEYEAILGHPDFSNDSQAYALLGYLEGLVGNREQAVARLRESLERERVPGFYPRLWLWILAPAERPALSEELSAFLDYPPAGISAWDVTLGRFVLGAGSVDEFLQAARAEAARRMDAGEPLDDLMCEVWFYVGVRYESQVDDPQAARAQAAYFQSLSYRPLRWKWEWAYARLFASRLGHPGGAGPAPMFQVTGDRLRLADPARPTAPPQEFVIESHRWHAPGTERPVAELGREGRIGDLLLARLRDDRGNVSWQLFVHP